MREDWVPEGKGQAGPEHGRDEDPGAPAREASSEASTGHAAAHARESKGDKAGQEEEAGRCTGGKAGGCG